MPSDLSFLPREPERVDEVIQDIRTLDDKTVAHYVVDPFEIATFCFPAQQAEAQSWSWAATINHVVALYEVFYGHSQHPILLDEYKHELVSIVRHFQDQAQRGLDGARGFELELHGDTATDVAVDFTAMLAVALGVFSEGLSLLKDLLGSRLVATEIEPEDDAATLRMLFTERRAAPGFAIEMAVRSLQEIIEDYEDRYGKPMPANGLRQRRNSIIVDAQAISRLTAIQSAALASFGDGKLDKRHLFYFISSAERTSVLFKQLKRGGKLPTVDGRWFSAWRTPQQVLLRLICWHEDREVAIRRLTRIRDIVEVLGDQKSARSDEAHLPTALRKQLADYRSSIEKHYSQVQTYGLASLMSTGRHFHRLLESKSDEDWVLRARHEIKGFLNQPDWAEKADHLVSLNLFFTGAKLSLADSLLHNLVARQAITTSDERHATRSGRDPVAGSRQHLPTVFRIVPEGYEEILGDIKRYFETPIHGRTGRIKVIGKACSVFLEKDTPAGQLGIEEIGHEFVRNLLFLALPPADADRFALDHSQDMLARIEPMQLEAGETDLEVLKDYEREFRYLACWAARRQADYRLGERWATEMIEALQSAPDPRFYHARCLNTYAWVSDYSEASGTRPGPRVTISRAIEDALVAADGYREWGEEAEGQTAVLYNSIACLYVYGLDSPPDVPSAREYLDRLKAESDKGTWLDRFPEYFHTEALVEFEEFKLLKGQGAEPSKLRDKLGNALREIDFAFRMYQENRDGALKHRDKVELLRSLILDAIEDCSDL